METSARGLGQTPPCLRRDWRCGEVGVRLETGAVVLLKRKTLESSLKVVVCEKLVLEGQIGVK
jgi:hypothetical protein